MGTIAIAFGDAPHRPRRLYASTAVWANVFDYATARDTPMNASTVRTEHLRSPGRSAACSREEMLARVARFSDRHSDDQAFPDLGGQQGLRSVSYRLSPGHLGGPAPISAPHGFHMSISTLSPGVRPTVHSHPYNEVFMPLNVRFRLLWGESLEEHLDLEPFDVASVPAGVFRTFENLDAEAGHMLAIFDHGGDPHTGIVVPPEVYERFYKGWTPRTAGQPVDPAQSSAAGATGKA